jgi:HD-like signal output (HDOD) protein/ActR/RegA family two-component response regulator
MKAPLRVLFVDDETRVLEAIERVLFDIETDWQTRFVSSGDEAMTELAREPYDVVVSDLRMSGMDGVALLTRVADRYPRTVRIVLSGHSDEEAALKMVRVAHQFLAKPCSAETVHEVIARTDRLTKVLGDRKLQALVGQVGALPCAAHLQAQLCELLERDDASGNTGPLVDLIRQDPALTCKLLQVANSAFFNSAASVADVETALMRLGVRTLKNLMMTLGAFETRRPSQPVELSADTLQTRSVSIARLASRMARLPEDASAAYIAGLLCNVGQLVLASAAPERLYVTQAEAAQRGVPCHLVEQSTWGATHAEIGGYLLGLWGLPFQIVEAVTNHHAPARADDDRLGLAQLVWLASCIVEGEVPAAEQLHRFGAEELYETHRREQEARS